MNLPKVLFIGGTGIISSACSELAVGMGMDLTLVNRGQSQRPAPAGARLVNADIGDTEAVSRALGRQRFDCVVDWIAFTPDQIERDIALFAGRAGQYVFISSASAYQTPPASLPVIESTPLANPYWEYSRNKIACEERLLAEYRKNGFPFTVVRPSHTYDRTYIPIEGGYTAIRRMREGKKVVVHGDGTSLWVLTHHTDFAKGFVGLLGNPRAVGEAFHITSDEVLNWNQIVQTFAMAAGVEAKIVHVPSDIIAAYDRRWGDGLLGDKAVSMVFDNSKIKRLVPSFVCTTPLAWGARECIAWVDADPARQRLDERMDRLMDELIAARERAMPR